MEIKRRERRGGRRLAVAAVCLMIAATVIYIDVRLRPNIKSMAASQANSYAVTAMSQTILERLTELGIQYDSLVKLTYGDGGEVTSLQTNIVALGTLQSDITGCLTERIAGFEHQSITVPLGSIIGNQWFSGRGPAVTFELIPANYVETTVVYGFDEAGINQTRHQIMLKVKLSLQAIAPGYRAKTEINTCYVLAETVIVGLVPESYTRVYEATDPVVGMLNDYGAENYVDD